MPNGGHKLYGVKGQGDLLGVGPGGLYFEFEVKTDQGQLRPEQVQHAAKVRDLGGYYFVVRDLPEARAALQVLRQAAAGRRPPCP